MLSPSFFTYLIIVFFTFVAGVKGTVKIWDGSINSLWSVG